MARSALKELSFLALQKGTVESDFSSDSKLFQKGGILSNDSVFCSKRQREKGTRMYKFMIPQADIQKLYNFWGKSYAALNCQRHESEKKTTTM